MNELKTRGERTTLWSDKISGLLLIAVRNGVKKHFDNCVGYKRESKLIKFAFY
jgi:hypothetical protein